MYIESISFSKKPIDGKGWEIKECNFNKINLIAGQNSSGKTRLLKSIDTLVNILSDSNKKPNSGFNFKWKITLKGKENNYIYELEIQDSIVLSEKLLINEEIYFERDKEGKGQIKYESKEDLVLEFEIEKDKIVLSSKRDKTQHPSLENLFKWMNTVYMYNFGDTLGREISLSPLRNIDEDDTFDKLNKDDSAVVLKFEKGLKKYGDAFKNAIVQDFNNIGYNIDNIGTTKMSDVGELTQLLKQISLPMPSVLYIKEQNIEDRIFQQDISQGMFRVLSLIIQIKYLEYELDFDTTILIDDIGEGLDYERATKLVKYIIEKVEKLEDKIQLIMTTNDRFTMNNIPLKYWIIIDKDDNGKINFYSKRSHSQIFKKFKRIGLTNFDFFSSEYYKEN